MKFEIKLLFYIFFLSIFISKSYGQIIDEDCSTQPVTWTFNSIDQNSGYWLADNNTDYVISPIFGAYTSLSLVSNLRSFGGGSAPECTIEISTDGGTTWTGGTEVVSSIPNSYTDYTWSIGTLSGTNNRIRWRRTDGTRGIRLNNIELTGTPAGPPADVTLSSPNPAVSAGTVIEGATNHEIYRFDLAVSTANATLTDVQITTNGTYAASNLDNIKLWYSTDATFNAGTDNLLTTKTTSLGVGTHTFTGLSQNINNGSTAYFFLTTDIDCSAGIGNTIFVDAITTADLTFASANKSGTAFASDAQTITLATPNDVSSQNTSSCGNGETTVGWTNPTGCFDAILIFASDGSFTSTLPTGNGSTYTANTSFGSGTGFDGGFCVYKGTGTSETITNLTNGTTYTYKIFTRNGTNWSSGVTTSCTPTLSYCLSNGDGSDGFNTGIRLVEFNTISNATPDEDNDYSDFTGISTTVEQGSTHNLTVNVNTDGNYTVHAIAWIDWNQDGDFDDTNETQDLGDVTNVSNGATSLSPLSITVPVGATLGNTRMRVSARYDENPTSCGTGFDGEVEDYTINITSPCTPTHSIISFIPTSGPKDTKVTITGTGFTASTSVSFGTVSATSVTFVSSTEIVAIVPLGFDTEKITVTESTCNVISSSDFIRTDEAGSCGSSNLTDLFISEVYDGDTGNKLFVELYNPTNLAIDLGAENYTIEIDNLPGVGVNRTVTLTGTVPANSVYLLDLDDSSNPCGITADETVSGPGINEQDEIFLVKNGTRVDEVTFLNETGYTFQRKSSATAPSATYNSSDWDISSTESCADLKNFTILNNFPTVSDITNANDCEIDLSITATAGNSGTLTYKWYFNDGVSTGWTEVNSSNLPTLTLAGETTHNLLIGDGTASTTTINDYQFYCEVTEDGSCTKLSNASDYTYDTRPIYRSTATGNWSDKNNWEMATTTSGPWVATCNYPTADNSDEVIIQNGTNITLDIDNTLDKITIETGAILQTNTDAQLSLNNATSGADLTVNGTFIYGSNNLNSLTFNSSATWQLDANATLIKTNGGGVNVLRDSYESGMNNIPANASWIYRYEGSNVVIGTLNFFYPNLTIESNSGTWDANTSNSQFTGSSAFATVKGNLDIGGTGSGTVIIYNENTNTQAMLIEGNVTVKTGNTLNNGTTGGTGFEIKGDVTVNGTFKVNQATGKIRLSGTSNQNIGGTGTINIYELEVEKPATTDVILGKSLTIDNFLEVITGDVDLNGNNIELGTSATMSEDRLNNHLVKDNTATTESNKGGYIHILNRTVNTSNTDIAGIGLALQRTSGSDYTVEVHRYHYSGNGGQAIKRVFEVAGAVTGTNTNLSVLYADDELNSLTESSLEMWRWSNTVAPLNWNVYSTGYTLNTSSNTAQGTTVNNFSHWTLGIDLLPLPLDLLTFEGKKTNKTQSKLSWTSINEKDLKGFEVQKSLDAKNFEIITFVNAQNSSELNQYEIFDNNFTQSAYYRLKQIEEDNSFEMSEMIFIENEESNVKINIYPNPFTDKLNIEILGINAQSLEISLISLEGKVLFDLKGDLETIIQNLNSSLSYLAKGTYILKIQTDDKVWPERLIKR